MDTAVSTPVSTDLTLFNEYMVTVSDITDPALLGFRTVEFLTSRESIIDSSSEQFQAIYAWYLDRMTSLFGWSAPTMWSDTNLISGFSGFYNNDVPVISTEG